MFDNYNPQGGQWYGKQSLTAIALSALEELNPDWAECIRSLLQEKDETIQSFEEKFLEQQQEIDDLRREHDWQPNYWDNDGSSNADCHDREYVTDRLAIS